MKRVCEFISLSFSQLSELQMQFNRVAVKKHSLGKTCYQLAESLTSASHLMERFSLSLSQTHTLLLTCTLTHSFTLSHTHSLTRLSLTHTHTHTLLNSFKSRQGSWQHQLDHTPSDCLLATNSLLAAAITTYLGPYATLSRFCPFIIC